MIVGLGLDIVELSRVAESLDAFGRRFEERILTPAERDGLPEQSAVRTAYLAARFAAKEAAAKALGTGIAQGVGFQTIEVRREESGRPTIHFSGGAQERMQDLGATGAHVSLTHGRDSAVAVVVLETS